MFTVLNPLFLALGRAMREDRSSENAWGSMLDRREMSGGDIISPVMGAPVYYVPRPFEEPEQRSN